MTDACPIRCRCGAFRAEVAHPHRATRAVCYCRDCQAFAHFLGAAATVLDANGGTDIMAVKPREVRFIAGVEHLACLSLTARGTIRWFSSCCGTPIGNTPRDFRLAHVGLIHGCLASSGAGLDTAFGPVRMRVNRQGAKGKPPATPGIALALALSGYMASLGWARLTGGYRVNPFFDAATGAPRVPPRVLTEAERAQVMSVVGTGPGS